MVDSKINYYDDTAHNYADFWVGREYEHRAELIAIEKLLRGRRYKLAMDYGGGYGRVTPTLLKFAAKVILVDPSTKQLELAKHHLAGQNVEFTRQDRKDSVPAPDNSLDLIVMIRVSHHLPDPKPVLGEIARALKPGGEALIEVANEAHFVNRMRYLKRLQPVPKQPVPVGERANGRGDDTPFVNHNPATIDKIFAEVGLDRIGKLSVSNLRHRVFKKYLPPKLLASTERVLQSPLAPTNFGPSIFFLVKKPIGKIASLPDADQPQR